MINKSRFEDLCNNASTANIANINDATTGESVLAAKGAGGGGISTSEEEDVVEYLDSESFVDVHDSNGNFDWLVAGRKDPC